MLFYADDGLLLARYDSNGDGECGLNINIPKRDYIKYNRYLLALRYQRFYNNNNNNDLDDGYNVLLFNHDGIRPEEVGGIRVSNTIRYLGADMGDSRMCFCEYRKGKIKLAERMANLTFSVISKSCDKFGKHTGRAGCSRGC